MDRLIEETVARHLSKGVDDEEDREETSEDFNPADTPDNLDQHPYDEEMWQRDYDAEEENKDAEEKECPHTDHRGRSLDEENCPHCGDDDE